jgi:hypothetical protein
MRNMTLLPDTEISESRLLLWKFEMARLKDLIADAKDAETVAFYQDMFNNLSKMTFL